MPRPLWGGMTSQQTPSWGGHCTQLQGYFVFPMLQLLALLPSLSADPCFYSHLLLREQHTLHSVPSKAPSLPLWTAFPTSPSENNTVNALESGMGAFHTHQARSPPLLPASPEWCHTASEIQGINTPFLDPSLQSLSQGCFLSPPSAQWAEVPLTWNFLKEKSRKAIPLLQ